MALQALIDQTQKVVNGTVRMKLYKGNVIVAGRKSPTHSLFDESIATFETMPGPTIRRTPKASSSSTPCACAWAPRHGDPVLIRGVRPLQKADAQTSARRLSAAGTA